MRRVPSPPVVSAALSGFVVGVLVTLLANGAFSTSARTTLPPATLPPATPTPDSVMVARVTAIVGRVLGPSDTTNTRLLPNGVHLYAAVPDVGPYDGGDRSLDKYRTVYISFRLLNHPLGPSWRLKEAKGDVFRVMKALYSSTLPVYDVVLQGFYPLPARKGPIALQPVLSASLDHLTAARIPWKRWGREYEGRLWTMLTQEWVDPRFA